MVSRELTIILCPPHNLLRSRLSTEEFNSLYFYCIVSGLLQWGVPLRSIVNTERILTPILQFHVSKEFSNSGSAAGTQVRSLALDGLYDIALRRQGVKAMDRRLMLVNTQDDPVRHYGIIEALKKRRQLRGPRRARVYCYQTGTISVV